MLSHIFFQPSAQHEAIRYHLIVTHAWKITVKHGDHLQYLRQPKTTVAVAECQGNAAMLLAAGTKGRRAALPHARMKVAPPRINREFGQTVNLMISANELQVCSTFFLSAFLWLSFPSALLTRCIVMLFC